MAKLNVKVLDMQNGEITKVAYEGAEYAKVESNALIGDLALCVNETPFFTVGEFYLAWDLYENGEPRMKDDADDNYRMRQGTYVLFRKISAPTLEERVSSLESDVAALKSSESSLKGEKADETIEFEGATYCKVDREAREGDVVILKATGVDLFKVGKKYKVVKGVQIADDDGDLFDLYSSKLRRTCETVDVYEAQYIPQEGDIVVVTDDSVSNHTLGDVGKITEVDGDTFRVTVPGKKNRSDWHLDFRFRKATPAEVEKYEQAVKDTSKPKLKAGDYVKFKHGNSDTKAGKPYLIEVDPSDGELSFKDDAGDFCDIDFTGEYEIISAEEAKWAKIGRKPNEFKKGDVVRVIDNMCTSAISIGDLAIVNYQNKESGSLDVSVPSGGTRYVSGELIAPVESLFNTNA